MINVAVCLFVRDDLKNVVTSVRDGSAGIKAIIPVVGDIPGLCFRFLMAQVSEVHILFSFSVNWKLLRIFL